MSTTKIEPGSLADRVCRWFGISANRREERTAAQIAQQFNAPSMAVAVKQLEPAIAAHLLLFTRGDDGMVYLAGPELPDWVNAMGGAAAGIPMAKSKKPRKAVVRLPALDLAKLTVRKDVPLPAKRTREKGHTRWDDLFDKLPAKGTSFEVPREYYPALAKAVQAYMKRTNRKVALRVVSDTACGVWRTE